MTSASEVLLMGAERGYIEYSRTTINTCMCVQLPTAGSCRKLRTLLPSATRTSTLPASFLTMVPVCVSPNHLKCSTHGQQDALFRDLNEWCSTCQYDTWLVHHSPTHSGN